MDKFNHQQQKYLIIHPSDLSTHQHVPPGGGDCVGEGEEEKRSNGACICYPYRLEEKMTKVCGPSSLVKLIYFFSIIF